MQFASIDYQIRACKDHLDATQTWTTEVEFILVQYLLIRIVADWELRIPIMFERRCARSADVHLKQFATTSAKYFSKRFAISEMGTNLKRFGADYHQTFHGAVMSTNAHTAWSSIYANRESVAHLGGVQMSFADLMQAYSDALQVFDALVTTLGLTPDETKDFV
jgi:hypothetical protein